VTPKFVVNPTLSITVMTPEFAIKRLRNSRAESPRRSGSAGLLLIGISLLLDHSQ